MIPTKRHISPIGSFAAVAALFVATHAMAAPTREPDARTLGAGSVEATLPVTIGWFDGMPCYYISTDVSDPDVAKELQVNYVPQLADMKAVSATKVIYAVTNFAQGNIVPSAPVPAGPGNTNRAYSPLWRVSTVTWAAGATPQLLRSEADVLAMQTAGKVTLAQTNIVVNCAILFTSQGGVLPGTSLTFQSAGTPGSAMATTTLPVTVGWFNGQNVMYVSTDASDAGAGGPDANLSLPLGLAANTPAVDDIFVIANFKQGNIIPSAPMPTGPANTSLDYTPLWQVTLITWNAGVTPHLLKSADDVHALLASGQATAMKTGIMVNCPVIYSPLGGMMPGVTVSASK